MGANIDDLMRKTKSYWYEDGLGEILAGLFFVVIGLFLLVDWATPQDAPLKWIFAPGFMLVTFTWILAGRKVVGWLKERITYPRTGYVAYHRRPAAKTIRRVIMAAVVGAAISLAAISSLLYRQEIGRVIPLIMGAGVAVLLVKIANDVAMSHFYVEAVWSLVVGVMLAWLTSDMSLGIALYYALLGVAVLVAGVVTLVRYLKAVPVEEGHDG